MSNKEVRKTILLDADLYERIDAAKGYETFSSYVRRMLDESVPAKGRKRRQKKQDAAPEPDPEPEPVADPEPETTSTPAVSRPRRRTPFN